MAGVSLLTKRAASATNQTLSLFKRPSPFTILLKTLTTSSSASAQNPKHETSIPKRRKKKNLFEVAQFLPQWGIGYHLAKSHWANVSYEITKINLYKDGRHGKAWGIAHKDGLPIADAPKKISGVHKRCWKYIPSLAKSIGRKENSPKSTETAAKTEVQAA
ncbi:mitochondrial 28S ribosomal protein [Salix suchowensis]|nr:mitochondrial 28S ribosomal protein [Salix suchowensis]